ncbi:MAG TPA: cytochrome b/b6 domain-containing protein [Longimicrobiales bacterium]|nr:cytochrome b/b6 domain-containing protein [Longimicrobiales bacterium]
MKDVYMVTRPERTWHWVNAAGIVVLALSGLNIHFAREFNLFGTLPAAIAVHNLVGILVSINYMAWALYLVRTGRIRYYAPDHDDLAGGLLRQTRYYLFGIFHDAPHPFEEGAARKFNPLQKWTYLGIMTVLLPLQVVTGLWLFHLIQAWQDAGTALFQVLGVAHTVLAILLTAFLIGHVYLATTGDTPWAHFRMMLTGYAASHVEAIPEERGNKS